MMRPSQLVALISVAVLAGCNLGDEAEPTKLEPLPENEFKFEIREQQDSLTEEEAEKARIAQLDKYLADNGLCPNGYVIKEKFPIVAEDDPLGQEHVMVYRGACK